MLVLSRKIGEKILIGSDIVVTVTAIDRDRVKIGIEAPDQVRILRSELVGQIWDPEAPKKGELAGCC